MKRILFLIAALLFLTATAEARTKVYGFCEDGGQTITVAGVTSSTTTPVQRSYPSCNIRLYYPGTLTLIPGTSVYSDQAGTVKGNPFTAASDGQWFAYVDVPDVDVNFSSGGILTPFTIGNYLMHPNADITTFGGVCDGTTNDAAAFTIGVNALHAFGGGTLTIPAAVTCKIGSSVATLADVSLGFGTKGMLSIGIATTTTIVGDIVADKTQHFVSGPAMSAGNVMIQSTLISELYPQWWGALCNGSHDDANAFASAEDAMGFFPGEANTQNTYGYTLRLPRGKCYLSYPYRIRKSYVVTGSGQRNGFDSTQLVFPGGVNGIEIYHHSGGYGADGSGTVGSPDHYGNPVLEHFGVTAITSTTTSYGIASSSAFEANDIEVSGFATDGINISTCLGAADAVPAGTIPWDAPGSQPLIGIPPSNLGGCVTGGGLHYGGANSWLLLDVQSTSNGRDGLHVAGSDSNTGTAINFVSQSNGRCGLWDYSAIGNTYINYLPESNSICTIRTKLSGSTTTIIGSDLHEGNGTEQNLVGHKTMFLNADCPAVVATTPSAKCIFSDTDTTVNMPATNTLNPVGGTTGTQYVRLNTQGTNGGVAPVWLVTPTDSNGNPTGNNGMQFDYDPTAHAWQWAHSTVPYFKVFTPDALAPFADIVDAQNGFGIGAGNWGDGVMILGQNISPVGTVTAPPGSLFMDALAVVGQTMFVKQTGSGPAGWVGVPTKARGTFTAANNADTTINDTNISAVSVIELMPTNAAAATLMGSNKSLYVSALNAGTSFVVTTASGVAAAGTETFTYMILN